MPNDRGILSEGEKKEIAQRLEKLWVGSAKNCPICGSNKWVIADHVVSAPIVSAGAGMVLGGPSYPSVLLVSEPCGYTIQFNAVILGVLKPSGSKLT